MMVRAYMRGICNKSGHTCAALCVQDITLIEPRGKACVGFDKQVAATASFVQKRVIAMNGCAEVIMPRLKSIVAWRFSWRGKSIAGSVATSRMLWYSSPQSNDWGGGCSSGRSVLRAYRDVSPEFPVGAFRRNISKGSPPPGGATIHMHHLYAAIQF